MHQCIQNKISTQCINASMHQCIHASMHSKQTNRIQKLSCTWFWFLLAIFVLWLLKLVGLMVETTEVLVVRLFRRHSVGLTGTRFDKPFSDTFRFETELLLKFLECILKNEGWSAQGRKQKWRMNRYKISTIPITYMIFLST